jgi:catechol 2,3-dioxygenase-like lactoylglutathione lyase family enzyme
MFVPIIIEHYLKFVCSMICVKDISASREFYENLFGLKVKFDFGKNIAFDCGLALQDDFSILAGISKNEIKYKTNNFELYFEEDDFDNFMLKLDKYKNIEYVHNVKEYDWGQRVIRFYDMDKHIIEVGESMDTFHPLVIGNSRSSPSLFHTEQNQHLLGQPREVITYPFFRYTPGTKSSPFWPVAGPPISVGAICFHDL